MQRILSKLFLLLLTVVLGASVSVIAHSAKGSDNRVVQLVAGKADTVELSSPVADVLVANPAIADVGTLRSNRLYIVGRAVGDTNVLAYDDAGNQLADITIHVRLDDSNLQGTLKSFFPDEKISVRTVNTNIILSGTVSSPSVANQVRDLVSRFVQSSGGAAPAASGAASPGSANGGQTIVDLMTVRGEQQVMLKVRVVEADRAALKELGVNTSLRPTSTGNGFNLTGADVGRVSNLTPFATGSLILGKNTRLGPLSVTLKALENEGLVNTLAEPNLTAISGETAGFLAGGEFPVPTSRDSSGNVIIEFKQFGVSLNFTPTVLSKERIALHLATEVSQQDTSTSVVLQNVTIPGLSVRRAETTVELGSGSTIMIAGLIKSDTLHAMNGLPGVQDLPILGQLFKSKSFSRNESELLIIVTPYLVNSYAQSDAVAEADEPGKLEKILKQVPEKSPEPVQEKANAVSPPSPSVPERPDHSVSIGGAANPLSQRFMENLRETYGKRVPEKIGDGAGLGYIVD